MRATQTILLLSVLLAGCGGCERADETSNTQGETGLAPKTAAPAGPTVQGKIQVGGVAPVITGREAAPAAPAEAPAAPAAPAPETGNDEGDCIVVMDANPDYGPPPLAVTFSAESECSAGAPKFDWNFGDGAPHSNEPSPSHTYTKAGEFTATITVTGPDGSTSSDEMDITVEEEEGTDAPEEQ